VPLFINRAGYRRAADSSCNRKRTNAESLSSRD
jgi:hypothetical protein